MTTRTTDEGTTILMAATERLDRAKEALVAAERWAGTTAFHADLRVKLVDQRRIDETRAELDAVQAAYEAAQGIEHPEV